MGVEITTDRLRLRPLEPADARRIGTLCGDLAVSRWLARVPHPYPAGEAERFIARCRRSADRVWAIERRGEPGPAGVIGVIGIDGPADGQSLGYWLGASYWGRGYASEAALAVVDWAFGEAATAALASGAFEGNAASLRVQEKLGFRVTGQRMLRCAALGRDLLHIDTALDRAGWEARA